MTQPKHIIIAGVMLASVAGFMTMAHLKKLGHREPVEGPATRRVIVASRPLSRGATIEEEDIKTIEWPESSVPEGAFSSPTAVLGRLARSEIFADDVLTGVKFLDTKAPSALSALIPKGQRAISVRVNEVTGIAGFVAPGSHVDVLLSTPREEDRPPQTKTIVQDVEVLAIAQSIDNNAGHAQVVDTVTLNVSPRQAETIALSANEGSLHFAMRNDRDERHQWTSGVNLPELMGGGGSEVAGNAVELILGGERIALTF